jgi:hypothetical protein
VRTLTGGRRLGAAAAALGVLLAAAAAAAAPDVRSWIRFGDGDWLDNFNWSSNNVPDSTSECAFIPSNSDSVIALRGTIDLGELDNQSTEAIVSIENGAFLRIDGDVVNNGVIVVGDGIGADEAIELTGNTSPQLFTGTGIIDLQASTDVEEARLFGFSPTRRLSNGPSHDIRGAGEILVDIDNAGRIVATRSTPQLVIRSQIDQTAGGEVVGGNGATLELRTGAEIIGGQIDTFSGGKVVAAGGNVRVRDAELTGDLDIEQSVSGGASFLLVGGNGMTNNGTITINASQVGSCALRGATNFADYFIGGAGTVVLNAGTGVGASILASSNASITFGVDQLVRGAGNFSNGDIFFDGVLKPDESVAILTGGRVSIESLGRVEVELVNPLGGNSRIIVAGRLDLGGTLIATTPGGVPSQSGSYQIVFNQGTVNDTFADFVPPPAAAGYRWAVRYEANGDVFVDYLCAADIDGSGVVDVIDLNLVLGNFNQTVPPGTGGDADGSGVVDVIDLNIVLGLFNQTC